MPSTNDYLYSIFFHRNDAERVRNDLLFASGDEEKKAILEAYRVETEVKKAVCTAYSSLDYSLSRFGEVRSPMQILEGILYHRGEAGTGNHSTTKAPYVSACLFPFDAAFTQ